MRNNVTAELYARAGAESGAGKEDCVSMSSSLSRGRAGLVTLQFHALLGR